MAINLNDCEGVHCDNCGNIFNCENITTELFVMSNKKSIFCLKHYCRDCKIKLLNQSNTGTKEISETIHWGNNLKSLEKYVATQITENIFKINNNDFKTPETVSALIYCMKKYSVRIVFEACCLIEPHGFDLKQIQNKCNEIIEKNKKRF